MIRMESECRAAAALYQAPLQSVFVGGGTPTMLRPNLLARTLSALRESAGWGAGVSAGPGEQNASGTSSQPREFTVEANPDTVTEEVARVLAESGVNRVSMGCQSFHPHLLKALERTHNPESVPLAVERLRNQGINNINLDLIFAIPGSSLADWEADLQAALKLEPSHLSCYGLVYEPNTPLFLRRQTGAVLPIEEDLEASMYELARSTLASAGYGHYEISNWSRGEQRCQHNLVYWDNGDWFAHGPSASGHASGIRWKNVPRLTDWLESDPWSLVQDVESLASDARTGEAFMLGLRLIGGMELSRVAELLAQPGGARREAAIAEALSSGLLERSESRLRIAPHALLVSDSVLCTLL